MAIKWTKEFPSTPGYYGVRGMLSGHGMFVVGADSDQGTLYVRDLLNECDMGCALDESYKLTVGTLYPDIEFTESPVLALTREGESDGC